MNTKLSKMGWSFHNTNPRFVTILTEAVFLLDPMGTGCVENHSWDEYVLFTRALDRRMGEADGNILTTPMIEEVAGNFFGDFGRKRVSAFFSKKAERIFTQFLGATMLQDFAAPPELRELRRMTKADLEWGNLETTKEFADSIECGAFGIDEDGFWVILKDGEYYEMSAVDPSGSTPVPEGATHAFWWGK